MGGQQYLDEGKTAHRRTFPISQSEIRNCSILSRVNLREAFDRHSTSYDARFSGVAIGERVRSEVWELADAAFSASTHILDLGSGTGEDAIHFARKGLHVTAVDVSPGMMHRLKTKADAAGLSAGIHCRISEMDRYRPCDFRFDGILSNFGAINCVDDLTWLRDVAQPGLKPGSRLVLTAMGSFYPLEFIVFLLKGQPRLAFRRLRRPVDIAIDGVPVRVHYHSLKSIERMLGPAFHLESVRGLRSLLPAPGWEHIEARVRWLAPIDRLVCRARPTATFADHFVSVWQYRP